MSSGIIEIDIHGMNQFQAKTFINTTLKRANQSVYMIRIIHGYHGGTVLRNMIRREYRSHPRILRIELSMNPGITELILKTKI